jgi:hypothetical protein
LDKALGIYNFIAGSSGLSPVITLQADMFAVFVCGSDSKREISLRHDFRLLAYYAALEVGRGQDLACARSELRVYRKHAIEYVQALLRHIFNEEFKRDFLMNCEGIASFNCQIISLSPVLLWRRAKNFEYGVYLVQLTLPREDGHTQEELGHDASHCKYITLWPIVISAQGTFRCSIPPG